jgi:hypothetical protein
MSSNIPGTDTPTSVSVPDKPALEGLEESLTARWRSEGTYKFDENTTLFVISVEAEIALMHTQTLRH